MDLLSSFESSSSELYRFSCCYEEDRETFNVKYEVTIEVPVDFVGYFSFLFLYAFEILYLNLSLMIDDRQWA